MIIFCLNIQLINENENIRMTSKNLINSIKTIYDYISSFMNETMKNMYKITKIYRNFAINSVDKRIENLGQVLSLSIKDTLQS